MSQRHLEIILSGRPAGQRQLGIQDPRRTQDPVWVWQGLHWTDGLFCGHQIKGASTTHPDKSAIAEHCADLGHGILFCDTSILATKTQYTDHIVREVIVIELHPNNMKREVSSPPSRNLCNMTLVPATRSTIGSTCCKASVGYCVSPLSAVFKSRPHPTDHWLTFPQPLSPSRL
jgi:hypothetical protein